MSVVYHYTIQVFLWNGLQNNNQKIKNFFFFAVTKLGIRKVHLLHYIANGTIILDYEKYQVLSVLFT